MSGEVSYGLNLTTRAAKHPDRTAIVHVDPEGKERIVSWSELDRRSNQVARALLERQATPGSVVAVALPNLPEHFFATYGAWKVGATVLPLRWSLPQWELERLSELAQPAVIISESGATGSTSGASRTMSLSDVEATVELPDGPVPDRVARPARAIATSGSTGRPKLIMNEAPASFDPEAPGNPMAVAGENIVQLVTSPLYHTNGFGCHLRLMAGATLVVMQRFDAELLVRLIGRWQVNHVILVPTMLTRVARLEGLGKEDLASLEHVYYGGAPLSPEVARRWLDLVDPSRFFFQYGGTEEMGGCMADGNEWLAHEGTVGRPMGCELRILDGDRNVLPPGEVGEIFFRRLDGPPTFRYVGAPPPAQTEDGFMSYGDLGWVDDEGYLYIADRRSDMVVTGGANVYPAEVELALMEHPGVADCAVIGLPHPEWGRALHAIFEARHPAAPPSDDELRQHCRDRLAPYKVPKSFERVDQLGRSEAGKINRAMLMAEREQASRSGS